MNEIIDKVNSSKIKNFSEKDNAKRIRRQATDWEKIFSKDSSDKGPLSKRTLETQPLRKQHNLKNGLKTLTDLSP